MTVWRRVQGLEKQMELNLKLEDMNDRTNSGGTVMIAEGILVGDFVMQYVLMR